MPLGYRILLATQLVLQQYTLVPADAPEEVRQLGTDSLELVFGLRSHRSEFVKVIRLVHVDLLGVLAEGECGEADAGLSEFVTTRRYVAGKGKQNSQ